MIYEVPTTDAPIRQGDIFFGVPRVDVPLTGMTVSKAEEGDVIVDWEQVASDTAPMAAVLPVRSVIAIVATQDCDALRGPDVTLCEIREFQEVHTSARGTSSPKKWVSVITQHSRVNLKWFYLPPDSARGLTSKSAVDFAMTLRLPLADLERLRSLRKCRLNPQADEHFRERLSEYFRRYPYDEWYPLDASEFAEYQKQYSDAEPLPWQKQPKVE